MANIYSAESKKNNSKLTPKSETIKFLLDYSNSLCVLETEKYSFEINKN